MFALNIPYELSYTHLRLQTKQKHKTVICTPEMVASLSFVSVKKPNQTPPPMTRNLKGRGLALTLMRFFNHDTNTDTDNG